MSLSKLTLKQETKQRLDIKAYKIINTLTAKIIEKIKLDTDIELLPSATVPVNNPKGKLYRIIQTAPNMVIEESEKKKATIDKIFKRINTPEDLKKFIGE